MVLHKNLSGEAAVHPFALPSETDPGAIGAYKAWFKPSTGEIRVRNAANDGWITMSALAPTTIWELSKADTTWSWIIPSALTELRDTTYYRIKYDLSRFTQARILANVVTAGPAGCEFRVQYSTDQTTWNYLDSGTGPSIALNAAGLQVGSWVNLVAGAKADVFLRIVGVGGDDVITEVFGHMQVQVK